MLDVDVAVPMVFHNRTWVGLPVALVALVVAVDLAMAAAAAVVVVVAVVPVAKLPWAMACHPVAAMAWGYSEIECQPLILVRCMFFFLHGPLQRFCPCPASCSASTACLAVHHHHLRRR